VALALVLFAEFLRRNSDAELIPSTGQYLRRRADAVGRWWEALVLCVCVCVCV